MSIKSDRWIRRMAEQHQMIEPFESGQVREIEGRKIVSYGTSSYGYDIRCSDEFKIFTNVHSTVVDPKHFDEKSFVDFKGDVCIIPPNSFALARTMEYFRIPRSVLTIASIDARGYSVVCLLPEKRSSSLFTIRRGPLACVTSTSATPELCVPGSPSPARYTVWPRPSFLRTSAIRVLANSEPS